MIADGVDQQLEHILELLHGLPTAFRPYFLFVISMQVLQIAAAIINHTDTMLTENVILIRIMKHPLVKLFCHDSAILIIGAEIRGWLEHPLSLLNFSDFSSFFSVIFFLLALS